jgi:SAM-dependent methyltransferase
MMSVFNKKYSDVYDLINKNKNYDQESLFILKLIKKYKIKDKKILDLGSGTCEHHKFFIKRNYKMTGVEKSLSMIQVAKKKKIKSTIIKKNILDLKLKEKFLIITSLFHVICYFTKDFELKKFFRVAASHLDKNGVFIFDYWYSPAVKFLKLKKTKKKFTNTELSVQRNSESFFLKGNIVKVIFNFTCNFFKKKINSRFTEIHYVRHFNVSELINFAKESNLTFLSSLKMLHNSRPSKKTWSACLVFKKK